MIQEVREVGIISGMASLEQEGMHVHGAAGLRLAGWLRGRYANRQEFRTESKKIWS